MLARPKSKLPQLPTTQNGSKVSKPYSILSMGLLKTSINTTTHRSREIPYTYSSIKTSGEINKPSTSNKTQNHNPTTPLIQDNNTSLVIPHDENSSYICNTHPVSKDAKIHLQASQNKCPSFGMVIDSFEDIITNKHHHLKLDNLTNLQIVTENIQKKQASHLCFIFDQPSSINQAKDSTTKQSTLFIDMKKKIKKLSRSKRPTQRHSTFRGIVSDAMADEMEQQITKITSNHFQLLTRIYSDREVISDIQGLRSKLKPQRIDNDVDTDDEQVNAGIKRLHRSLAEVVEEFPPMKMEEDLICSPLPMRTSP